MPYIKIGEFLPDQPDYENPGSSNVRNCLPNTVDSYRPMPSLQPYSAALASAALGGAFMRASDASVHGFSGTTSRLYTLTSGSTSWSDVTQLQATKTITGITQANPGVVHAVGHGYSNSDVVLILAVVGMTQVNGLFFTVTVVDADHFSIGVNTTGYGAYVSGGTAQKELFYSVGAGETWNFAVMDQRVVAVNINTAPQTFLVGTDTAFSNLSSGAPKARYAAVVRDFLMLGNTFDGSNGNRPQRVWWSALGDGTNWPTPGTVAATQVQSDYQDLLGEGGWVQGLVPGLANADVAIFQERLIWRGSYVGSPDIFSFSRVDSARGTPIPGSIVLAGGVAYYISDVGIMAFDGAAGQMIGEQKVDRYFWNDVDQSSLSSISAAADPQNKLVFWAYPGSGSSGGVPNKLLVYHYGIQRFAVVDLISVERLLNGLTVGYTLDQTFTVLGYTLDTLPFPLDSRAWTGGRLAFAAFDTNHKLGFFSGSPIAATMDTSEAELNNNALTYVNRVWAETDAGSVTLQVGYRNRIVDQVTWTGASTIDTTNASAGIRATGRLLRARMNIPAGATWTVCQGIDVDARAAGKR